LILDNDTDSELAFTYQHAGSGIYVGNMTFQGGSSNLDYFTAPPSGAKYRTKRTTPNGGVYLYDFDANMDLVKVTEPPHYGSATSPYTTYSWNGSRQLVGYTYNNGYDLAGNVTDLDGSTFATYDAANKFSSLSGGTYSYDVAGNLTAANLRGMGNGTFSYETRQKLDEQATSTTSLRYNYDVFGKRLLVKPSTSSSTYTWYVFDGDKLVGEIGTGGAKVAYTWGADGIVSERIFSGNKSRYYHFGPQGETRQLTNTSGTVTNTYLYTAYGTTVSSSGSDYNPHRYGGKVGYYSEGSLGLMLAQQRWYSPHLMRWLARDPIEYRGGQNLYAYVRGNPVMFIDPDGLIIVFNRSGKPIKYKPEQEENIVRICMPNEHCDMDGYYPDGKRFPIKVSSRSCLSPWIDESCDLRGACIPGLVYSLSPEFFEQNENWPDPFTGENGWPMNEPLKPKPFPGLWVVPITAFP
jgi:RHS repeat-associated protein